MEPGSPALQAGTLLSEPLGKPWSRHYWSYQFMANRWGNNGNSDQPLFSWAPKSLRTVSAAMKFKTLAPWKKSYDKPGQHVRKQRHYFADKGPSSQCYDFSSGHVWK